MLHDDLDDSIHTGFSSRQRLSISESSRLSLLCPGRFFTNPSLHQDFCKSQPDSQVHSTAPAPTLILHRRHWFHWSAPPDSCWRRRGSAVPKVAQPLGPQPPTPPDAAGTRLRKPLLPVNEICGKYAALATPIWALAAINCASADL